MIKTIKCFIPMCNLPGFTSGVSLPPNEKFTIIVDYPLEKDFKFEINTSSKGMDSVGLYNCIGRIYKKIYKNPDKYGVFGHDIEDLSLESITINFNKRTITLGVGS